VTRELPASVHIPVGWNGPATSANGGIAAGLMAALVDGPAEVRLSSPPPTGTRLRLRQDGDWIVARRPDGEQVMAVRATPPPDVEIPDVALDAITEGVPFPDHPAVTCVVCGVEHPQGLGVYPAPVAGDRGVLATWWTPPAWSIDGTGHLRPELQWGVLDCPGALAIMHEAGEPTFAALVGITGEVLAPVRRDERVLVLGFTLASDGRKRGAGTAILRPDGELLAHTRQLCIAVPPDWAAGTD
jgi:hypothetical protein